MTPAVLDITLATLILLSMGVAYLRGLIRELFTIVAIGGGSFAAYKGGHLLVPEYSNWLGVSQNSGAEEAEMVSQASDTAGTEAAVTALEAKKNLIFGVISPELAATLSSYGTVFIGTWLVLTLASFSLSRLVAESGLGVIDRMGGAAFGFARGFLFVFLLYLPATMLIDQEKFPAWAKNSKSVPILEKTFVWADGKFDIRGKIEDDGDGVAIKLDKLDPRKLGDKTPDEEQELHEELTREEQTYNR